MLLFSVHKIKDKDEEFFLLFLVYYPKIKKVRLCTMTRLCTMITYTNI